MQTATQQSLIPLVAYARQYDQYLELMNLDIKTYIRSETLRFSDCRQFITSFREFLCVIFEPD